VAGAIHAYRGVRAGSAGNRGARARSVDLLSDGTVAVALGSLRGGAWTASFELGPPEPPVLREDGPAPATGAMSASFRLHFR
jgi:hypothetical protein